MRYGHNWPKITPKEYAIMVVSKNDQVYVSHIVLHTIDTCRNITQLDNYRKWFYSNSKAISNGTSLRLQIVQAQYNVPTLWGKHRVYWLLVSVMISDTDVMQNCTSSHFGGSSILEPRNSSALHAPLPVNFNHSHMLLQNISKTLTYM